MTRQNIELRRIIKKWLGRIEEIEKEMIRQSIKLRRMKKNKWPGSASHRIGSRRMKKIISKQNGTLQFTLQGPNKWKQIKSAFTPNKQEQEHLNTNQRTPTLSKNNTRDTRARCLKSRRRARYGQGSSTFQESMLGLMAWSRLSIRQRYKNRLKKNRNRLRNNGVPSVKENDPIPK